MQMTEDDAFLIDRDTQGRKPDVYAVQSPQRRKHGRKFVTENALHNSAGVVARSYCGRLRSKTHSVWPFFLLPIDRKHRQTP